MLWILELGIFTNHQSGILIKPALHWNRTEITKTVRGSFHLLLSLLNPLDYKPKRGNVEEENPHQKMLLTPNLPQPQLHHDQQQQQRHTSQLDWRDKDSERRRPRAQPNPAAKPELAGCCRGDRWEEGQRIWVAHRREREGGSPYSPQAGRRGERGSLPRLRAPPSVMSLALASRIRLASPAMLPTKEGLYAEWGGGRCGWIRGEGEARVHMTCGPHSRRGNGTARGLAWSGHSGQARLWVHFPPPRLWCHDNDRRAARSIRCVRRWDRIRRPRGSATLTNPTAVRKRILWPKVRGAHLSATLFGHKVCGPLILCQRSSVPTVRILENPNPKENLYKWLFKRLVIFVKKKSVLLETTLGWVWVDGDLEDWKYTQNEESH